MLSANTIAHPTAHIPSLSSHTHYRTPNRVLESPFTALDKSASVFAPVASLASPPVTASAASPFVSSSASSAAFGEISSNTGVNHIQTSSAAAAAAAASAFAFAATAAVSSSSAVAATAALAAAAMAASSGNNGAASAAEASHIAAAAAPLAVPAPRAGMPLLSTMGGMSCSASDNKGDNIVSVPANNAYVDSRAMGVASSSPLVAPRPVAAHQSAPPAWMLAALPLEVLLGLAAPSFYKQKIINDVFFTPEERFDSPRLTPVSDLEDTRVRPAVPNSEIENLDLASDLALFADDAQNVESSRAACWSADEIETTSVCSVGTRHPSPTPTVTSEFSADEDMLPLMMLPGAVACGGSIASDKCHHSPLSAHVAQSKSQYSSCVDSDTASLSGESCVGFNDPEPAMVRESLRPTIFEELSHNGVDWCRYCGTTEGINWRPGPWGKRTLCNKHGCDYKGYGFASKMPRLNLKNFVDEMLEERIRPVLQTFCQICQQDFSEGENVLMHCDGCHRAYHQCCHPAGIASSEVSFDSRWYCEPSCRDNARKRRIVVELPKCRLPYMCSPRHNAAAAAAAQNNNNNTSGGNKLEASAIAAATRGTRSRKRKQSATPEPETTDSAAFEPVAAQRQQRHSCAKVRKSSRVTRPSFKRLASDYVI
ncbi:hypothetical protein GGI07_005153 [Coemansia sp. Benny D115]|nr:hypothetical protein GGI07_005153 [Coemansia sp. Benny D115]